jgi:hypothetical protein
LTGQTWDVDDLEWESDNFWFGGYTAEEIAGFTAAAFHVIPSVEKIATVWQIEIDDTANTDGYVEIGRVFLGPGWQPGINLSYGAALGFETNTGNETSLSDVEFFAAREPVRVFRFNLDALTTTEGATALEIMRQAGIHREVVVIPDPSDSSDALRSNFMGRIRQLSPRETPYFQTNAIGFEVKEIR